MWRVNRRGTKARGSTFPRNLKIGGVSKLNEDLTFRTQSNKCVKKVQNRRCSVQYSGQKKECQEVQRKIKKIVKDEGSKTKYDFVNNSVKMYKKLEYV